MAENRRLQHPPENATLDSRSTFVRSPLSSTCAYRPYISFFSFFPWDCNNSCRCPVHGRINVELTSSAQTPLLGVVLRHHIQIARTTFASVVHHAALQLLLRQSSANCLAVFLLTPTADCAQSASNDSAIQRQSNEGRSAMGVIEDSWKNLIENSKRVSNQYTCTQCPCPAETASNHARDPG